MAQISAEQLDLQIGRVGVVSVDVFDTLLLRTVRSERSRIVRGERMFSELLARRNLELDADLLVDARLEAQRVAFRALNVGGWGEVRLADLIQRQLHVLGLPAELVSERLRIELEVERSSLRANKQLAGLLRTHREAGGRVVAVSDTTLTGTALRDLIEHFHGTELVHAVYSSADHGKTKRRGDLFTALVESEQMPPERILHLGDDYAADVQAALRAGLSAHHASRHPIRSHLRRIDGALSEVGRVARRELHTELPDAYHDSLSFGREVLGPITTHFCQLLWMYAAQAEATHRPVLLFCARGGVGIRAAFEQVLAKSGLPLSTRRETVMISRVVAARAALIARSEAASQELDREFRGGTLADAAQALGCGDYQLTGEWLEPFAGGAFVELLFGPGGARILADIRRQNELFTRHLESLVGGADRVILCDTGLYGSTHRMLAAGFPDLALETVQFARSNYKRHGEEHFPRVAGLIVERTGYSPMDVHSCVLRYWHLVESLFEPALPSVRLFHESALGDVAANCGDIAYGVVDAAHQNQLLAGALEYIEGLSRVSAAQTRRDAAGAWRRLKKAITLPTDTDVRCLALEYRSVDFGRGERVRVLVETRSRRLVARLRNLQHQLWREGAVARDFPVLKHALLPLLETVQSLRGIERNARPPGP